MTRFAGQKGYTLGPETVRVFVRTSASSATR